MTAGDTIQVLLTKKYLERLNIKVDLISNSNRSLKDFSLIHIFGISNISEIYPFINKAKNQKIKIAISPIFWISEEYINSPYCKLARNNLQKQDILRKEILELCDILLPNSLMEANFVLNYFSIDKAFKIIPNCADISFYSASSEKFVKKTKLSDYILCVGRICPRKNQLSLIKAFRSSNIPLLLIGPVEDKEYFKTCKENSGSNIFFLNAIPHHELNSVYAGCKVHVLPSWFETPGLASLEAGLAGANIVVTEYGCTKEYFKDYAYYCQPYDTSSIYKSVMEAYQAPKKPDFKEYIFNNYTWEKASQKTLDSYHLLL